MKNSNFEIMAKKIGDWLLNGHTGLSSKFMAATALGAEPPKFPNYPHDGGDFGRCFELVEAAPEIKHYFNVIAQASNEWRAIIDNWDALVETMNSSDNSVYTHIQRLIKPEEYERSKQAAAEAQKARVAKELSDKLEIESPKTNASGAIIFPRFENKIVNKWCRDKASKEAVEQMIKEGLLTESDRDSTVEELSDALRYNSTGVELFNSMGFISHDDDMEMVELLDTISVHHQYQNYLIEWVGLMAEKGIEVKPTFSVGDTITFKPIFSEPRTGVIEEIYGSDKNHYPFSYMVNTGDPGKPLVYWGDESLVIAEQEIINPDDNELSM